MKHNTKYPIPTSLLLILLLALALRVYHLNTQSLWYDEAVTAQVAAQGIAELTRWTAGDIQPPLYYYLVAGWTLLAGRSEWALRFPSAFFGVLTVALLWAVARRLLGRGEGGRGAVGIVALLSALSPLYVYYAQEARMYTLLTLLGVLAGYALLRATEDGGRTTDDERRKMKDGSGQRSAVIWWLTFVGAATALLYTHYFGVFLLAAYGLIVGGVWGAAVWRQRRSSKRPTEGSDGNPLQRVFAFLAVGFNPRRPWLTALLAFLAIALLYLPWLPALLTRYRVDASYWQGSLKLGEALRHIAISFTSAAPEMMLEADAVRLLPWFAVALGAAVVGWVWQGSGGAGEPLRGSGGAARREQGSASRGAGELYTRLLVYLSICLLFPIFAILLLASRTPKFNPRYLMLVSPAYFLILAGGIGYWIVGIRCWGRRPERRNPQDLIPEIVSLMLILFLLLTSITALHNWFTDPAFTKAQWRDVAAFVRQARSDDEAVLLVSGHSYPAWDYYAADIPAVRLPDIDILDVNAVLGFEVGPALAQVLAGKRGAWLVSWQDEVVDPVGFVPHFLARGGAEQVVGREFWHVRLRHWRLRPDATFPAAPQPQHRAAANFDHKLALLGWDEGPAAGEITVYWQTLNMLTEDYQLSLVVEDATGREIGRWDGRPASYDYPTTRWQPGQALFGRYRLPVPADLPAGDYYATLAVFHANDLAGLNIRDVADNPAGKRARIGPLRLGR